MMRGEYFTTAEAATILGVSSGWVAAFCRNGILEATGGGRGVPFRIDRSAVIKLAEERSVDPEAVAAVKKEIEEDEEAQELAKKKAEDGFKDKVISIAKRVLTKVRQWGPLVIEIIKCFFPA